MASPSSKLVRNLTGALGRSETQELVNILKDAGADGSALFTSVTFVGATGINEIVIPTNLAEAVVFTDGSLDYLTFVSTTGATGVTPVQGINAAGGFTASPRNCHTGGEPAIATTSGTNTTDNTAGTVYLAEVFVPCNMTVTGIAIFNGTAVAGKGKVMLYDSTGTRIAMSETATGGTTMTGTTAYQLIPFDPAPVQVKGPATYFIGATYDTTTHDLRGHVVGTFATGTDAGNTYATDSTFATVTLPTTFTTAVGPIASLY